MHDAADDPAEIPHELPSSAGAPAAAVPPAARTVLLVDDNAGVRAVARLVLTRAGYAVVEAANGVEALRELAEAARPVDVLLTDMVMPHMGGGDLAIEVRVRCPSAALVLMSGYGQEVLAGYDALRADAVFVRKPFTATVLLQGIAAAIAGRPGAPRSAAAS